MSQIRLYAESPAENSCAGDVLSLKALVVYVLHTSCENRVSQSFTYAGGQDEVCSLLWTHIQEVSGTIKDSIFLVMLAKDIRNNTHPIFACIGVTWPF